MDVIKKKVYLKRLYLHTDTVLTKNLRMKNIMKTRDSVDCCTRISGQLSGSPQHRQLKARVYRIATQHAGLLSI